jgi:hypothetical protein
MRGIFQMRSTPVVIGGLYFIAGYIWAGITRTRRPVSAELMAFHRKEQFRIQSQRKVVPRPNVQDRGSRSGRGWPMVAHCDSNTKTRRP